MPHQHKQPPTDEPTPDHAASASATGPHAGSLLRQQAEERLQAMAAQAGEPLTPHTVQSLLHELQVQQVELELQNAELRQSQLALEQSKAEFVDLYELAPVGYCTVSEAGLITRANLTLCTLLGVARKQLEHKPLSSFIIREDQDSYYRLCQRMWGSQWDRQPAVPAECELRMVKGDGTPMWAQLSATVAPDSGMHVTLTDTSTTKQSKADLQQTEARFRALADLSADWYWEQDREFRLVSASERTEDLSNLPVVDLLGKTRWELPTLGVSPAQWEQHQAELQAHQEFRHFEYARLTPAGELRWVSVSGTPIFDADGQFSGYRGVARDITERKLSETQLRKLSRITEQSPMVIVIADLSGAVEYVNPRFTEVTGYSAQEVLGKNPRLLQSGQTPAETYVEMWQTLLNGQVWRGELINRKKNGDTFVESVVMAPVVGGEGSVTHYVALKEDITLLRQQKQELRAKTRQLATLSGRLMRAQESERRHLAVELHDELGQSLTAIKINLQMQSLRAQPSEGEPQADNIRMVDHVLQQVRGMALALRPSMLDDLGLVPALRWLAESSAVRCGCPVLFHADSTWPRLATDMETCCFRVAQESLTNVARHAKATQVDIALRVEGESFVLTVHDDGHGFDAQAARVRAMAGGSLGLLGMQERAELIGGQLDILSAPGKGCTVRLRGPLRLAGVLR